METVKITQRQLESLLSQVATKGTTFANITYFVDESKSRQVKGVKQVQKQVSVNVTLNSDYARKVNKIVNTKQGTEIDFVPQEMKGKVMINSCVLQSLKDAKLMLYACIEHNAKRNTIYFHNGVERTVSELKELDVLAPAFFQTVATKGRGAVSEENDFALISPKLENIKKIKVFKIEHELI